MKTLSGTYRIAVLLINKYLPPKAVIWCLFDTGNSEFVLVMKEHEFTVIHSHILIKQKK